MPPEPRRDFDTAAATWDEDPRRVKAAEDVVAAIRREVPIAPMMTALDYGCGSGLVTLGLQPLVKRITGADSSHGMLEALQRKVRERGLQNVDAKLLDLEQQSELEGKYDLIVSSMTMHHVADVSALIGVFTRSLNSGGWLAIADLQSDQGRFHDDATGVLHNGFAPGFFETAFTAHGLVEVRVTTAAIIEKPDRPKGHRLFPVLLCVGRKE